MNARKKTPFMLHLKGVFSIKFYERRNYLVIKNIDNYS